MNEKFLEKTKIYCDALYYGLSFQDALILAKINLKKLKIKNQIFLKKIGDYTRAKSKLELLKMIKDQELGRYEIEKYTFLLESCWHFTRDSASIKLKKFEINENIKFKEKALAQAADIASTRLALNANQTQLAEWSSDDV